MQSLQRTGMPAFFFRWCCCDGTGLKLSIPNLREKGNQQLESSLKNICLVKIVVYVTAKTEDIPWSWLWKMPHEYSKVGYTYSWWMKGSDSWIQEFVCTKNQIQPQRSGCIQRHRFRDSGVGMHKDSDSRTEELACAGGLNSRPRELVCVSHSSGRPSSFPRQWNMAAEFPGV